MQSVKLRASRVEIADPFAKSDSPICAYVGAAVEGRELGIHFLHRVAGVGRDELERTAVSVEAGGANIRVMHPLLCLEGRVVTLLSRFGERGNQDQLHLRRSWLNDCLELQKLGNGQTEEILLAKELQARAEDAGT